MQKEQVNQNHFELDNSERIKIFKAERLLAKNLLGKFPGIEYIANEISLSETKLKASFKLVYGQTVFHYFQSKQMQSAKALLQSSEIKIADLASRFGYENASKFSAAFKSNIGVLPSEV